MDFKNTVHLNRGKKFSKGQSPVSSQRPIAQDRSEYKLKNNKKKLRHN